MGRLWSVPGIPDTYIHQILTPVGGDERKACRSNHFVGWSNWEEKGLLQRQLFMSSKAETEM